MWDVGTAQAMGMGKNPEPPGLIPEPTGGTNLQYGITPNGKSPLPFDLFKFSNLDGIPKEFKDIETKANKTPFDIKEIELTKQYNDYANAYRNKVWNQRSNAWGTFHPYYRDLYNDEMNQLKAQRDNTYKLLWETKQKNLEYMQNLQTQKNKYSIESEAMQKMGLNNPYFMLKNGPMGGGTNVSLGTNFGKSSFKTSNGINEKDEGMEKLFKTFLRMLPIILMKL